MENRTLLFQRLMENVTESVFFKDKDSRFIAINTTCALKFGLSDPIQAVGKSDFDFFGEEHARPAFEDEQRIMDTLEPIIDKEEREVFIGSNEVKWTSTSKFPLIDEAGILIGTYGITKDITQKKKNFEENRRLKEQVEAILNAVPNLIFVKNKHGKYVMANAAARNFFDPEGILIGKSDESLGVHPDKIERYRKADRKVLEEGKPHFFSEEKTKLADGAEVWHQTIKVPITSVDSDEQAVLAVITDVSQRIQYEVELVDSLQVIGKQNERLSNFAHIVSHNLRNHAGGISMLLELIESAKTSTEKDELFGLLRKASERLYETIYDLNVIIDKQNKVETELKAVNLEKALAGVKEVLSIDMRSKNVVINEHIEKGLTFRYNQAYIESILLNLISNAIKYKHPDRDPEIDIYAWKEENEVKLEIQDNGIGVDLDRFGNQIFGMYKTFHENDDSKGIGLYITKNQIESLGGTIRVESTPGSGSRFIINFGTQHRNRMLVPA
jgi:PAS domain S-box-containing protein